MTQTNTNGSGSYLSATKTGSNSTDGSDEAEEFAARLVDHPFAQDIDISDRNIVAPEFIVDDVLVAGLAVIAGERGLGKTSFAVPFFLAATGLLKSYPLKASIRRQVVYVAEDTAQVTRIIHAMADDGLLDLAEVKHWFHLKPAKRASAAFLAEGAPLLDDMYTVNETANGSTYAAPPVVVLDTTNANIELDNQNDNSEVSRTIATLRQRFGRIPIARTGHIAKASRQETAKVTFIGAGAWEGDSQQTLYLVWEEGNRYLLLGKKRFEADVSEYLIKSHMGRMSATDVLGYSKEIRCYYGIPEATTREAKEAAKRTANIEMKKGTQGRIEREIKIFVGANPGASKRKIVNAVSGNNSQVSDAIAELVEIGSIIVENGKGNAVFHSLANGNALTQKHPSEVSPF